MTKEKPKCQGGKDGKPCDEKRMSYTTYCKKHYVEKHRGHMDAIKIVLLEEIKDKL